MSPRVRLPIAGSSAAPEAPPRLGSSTGEALPKVAPAALFGVTPGAPLRDARGRPLRDLRLSVTDRCNFRCGYCMPKQVFGPEFRYLSKRQIASFEELTSLARIFVGLGVDKLRLTGGEPLLRRELPKLIEQLAPLGTDLALTTNGSLLEPLLPELMAAGLRRVTISLDSVEEATFRRMNDVDFPLSRVLAGIDAALAAGLPTKINCVVRRGINDHQVVDLASRFKGTGAIVRFIEFMDVGNTNGWDLGEVTTGRDIVHRIALRHPVEPVERSLPGEVATRWRYRDGSGEIGVITSISKPFCGDCTRARISAEGKLYTCLFASRGHDLLSVLQQAGEAAVRERLIELWGTRTDRYSELRAAQTETRTEVVEMSHIGG